MHAYIAITCAGLMDTPSNGFIRYSNEADSANNYPFGTSAEYVCDEGFGLVDGITSRECDGDGVTAIGNFVGFSTTCRGQCVFLYPVLIFLQCKSLCVRVLSAPRLQH